MNCRKCSAETGADWKDLCYACFKSRSPDEIRAYRQKKLDNKIARLEKKATRLEKEGSAKTSSLDQFRGDTAFFTQPANPNKGFGKYRQKLYNKVDSGFKLLNEADDLRSRAEWLRKGGVQVKGDAERKRDEQRKKADTIYKVGSKIYDFCFRDGIVMKVNKKTYTIKFNDSGSIYTRDKSYFV
jgi:uncharacterized coiled-coil DUF342 family protein